jgi:hypothetical protein
MSTTIENIELQNFYTSWMQDITAIQQADEEGSNSEQIFTQGALDLLGEAGEVENYRTAYDKKAFGTGKQHKINAYGISENYETVDLFISIFKGTEDIIKTTNDEIEQASKRISNFFRKAIYSNDKEKSKVYSNEYVDEIEETSEIFQFANTLAKEKDLRDNLVRVNAIIITNGIYNGEFPESIEISGYKIYYKVFDLQALYNVSEKSHIPIEINFFQDGFEVPCIASPSINSEYQSYLAIIPGMALASIYERFGSRLLEQNVRSFLQFSGKINKGIRGTIKEEPHMFLAFNNGIAATADEVEFTNNKQDNGLLLSKVNDLQIVNGGQTTASIYHTWKKDKADISNIFVQVKLSVIKNKENFSNIVSRISEYANTQNKVNSADLSSNHPFHIEFEKLSRSIYTPLSDESSIQTRWFYERARGQYKNARQKDGFTKSRLKAFDLKTPQSQMFTKEDLAKYINSYQEEYDGKKLVIGPNFVTKNTKNYSQFILYKTNEKKLNNIYFEDAISKAILFKACNKIYGVKPNSIGDLKFVVVPYTISYFGFKTNYQLDLYKIWKTQKISENLASFLKDLMIKINKFFNTESPDSLIYMWARKEECWEKLKKVDFDIDWSIIREDLINKKNLSKRQVVSEDETSLRKIQEDFEKIKSIPYSTWKKIEDFGNSTKLLSSYQSNIAFTIAQRVRTNAKLSDSERTNGLIILDIVFEKSPDILFESEDFGMSENTSKSNVPEITIDLIKKMVDWDKRNKKLKDYQFKLMYNILNNNEILTKLNIKYCQSNYTILKKYGFK